MKLLIIVVLLAIIASLGSGLFFLVRDQEGSSRRVLNSLVLRVALSVLLFVLLIAAWLAGLIQPHATPVP